jgi:transglutaminase-like putative cysteine protease
MKAIWKFLSKKISLTTLAYLALIYLIMYFVLLGAELVVRGTSVEVLRSLILFGVLIGWILGRSPLKFWPAFLIALVSGFLLTLIHIGGIDTSIWNLIKASFGYLINLVLNGFTADAAPLSFHLSVIQSRILEMINGLSLWLSDLLTGFMVYNQVSTLISWGYLMFLGSAWLSWVTRRKDNPLLGVIPAGVLLSILMTYTLEKRILLVFLLGAGLILIGLINHDVHQREWKKRGIRGSANAKERVIFAVLGFSLYTMVFAGLMPSIRINAIAEPFERLVYGDTESGDGGAEGSIDVGGFNSELYTIERFAGLPRQKLIGTGPELAKRVVMIVQFPTTAFVESDLPNAARYWGSYSYDQYTGRGWQASPTVEVVYSPGQEIVPIQYENFEIVTQRIRLSNALRGTLYSAGSPVTVDQDVLVSWRTLLDQPENGDNHTYRVDDLFAATIDQLQYQVRSQVSSATDEDLRSVEVEIPQWVEDRYLDLPDTVPDRVLRLAGEIVANQPTQYDQAKAIETFLRTYPYTLDLPAPPADRDVADYFLFDLQTGYCDYYATSMVVLSRAVGLPARAVVGYVGGQYEEENDRYLVSEADAHTWVEIYFGQFGWIPFEPTAAIGLIDDDELDLPLPPELEQLPQAVETVENGEFPWLEVGVGAFSLIGIGLWFWNRADLARLGYLDAASLVLVIYQRVFRYSRWMGLGHLRSDTLYEFSSQIKTVFSELTSGPRRAKQFKDVYHQVDLLTRLAVLANYSDLPVHEGQKDRIIKTWKHLRIRLRKATWLATWKAIGNRMFKLERKTSKLDDILGNGAADGKR